MKLDERARRAARSIHEQADAVDSATVLDRVRGERPGRRRVLLIGATAATTVALIIAVVALVLPPTDPGPVIDPVVPGDPEPTDGPTATTAPEGGDAVGTWEDVRSETFTGPGDQVITGLAVSNGIAVAVGGDVEQAAVWRSGRGEPHHWERVPADLCGEASCAIRDVTALPEVFLAVGQLDGLPEAWTSEDGSEWHRIGLPQPGLAGITTLQQVVSGGDGSVVALGSVERPGADGAVVAYRAASTAAPWEEVDVDVPSPQETPASVGDLTWFPGGFVAIVHTGDGFSFIRSEDGTVWTQREPEPGVFEPYPTFPSALLVHGDRLLAAGATYGEDGGDAAVWTSDNGLSWQRLSGADLSNPGHQTPIGASVLGGHPVMVGEEFQSGSDAGDVATPAAWQRSNEGTWARIDHGTSFEDTDRLTMAAPWDDRTLLAAGARYTTDDGHDASLWIYRLPASGPSEDLASCSTNDLRPESLSGDPDLPSPVVDMRRAIWDAALACDLDALEALALDGPHDFTYSFGQDGKPAYYWKRHEEEGAQPLLELAQLLAGDPATIETQFQADVYETVHVWPAAFAQDDGYVGLRVGITSDGDWVFFVAGD